MVNTNGTEVKLYAVWKQNTVDIAVNDGVNPQYTITVGQGDVLPDSVTIPVQLHFEGWYTDASFAEDTKWDSKPHFSNTGNIVCKMVYQRIYHSVL